MPLRRATSKVQYHPSLGVAAPALRWVPSPTFILRRAAIFDHIADWPAGRVLEVGCGPGALLYDLALRGFEGFGVETSDQARSIAAELLRHTARVQVEAALPETAVPAFDYLFSFEVLEHIEDDCGALRAWLAHLKPGGMVLCSVPAEQRRFNATDLLAGHFRRYDRVDVEHLVSAAGLHLVALHSCGAPATRVIERLRLALCTLRLRRAGIRAEDLAPGDPARTSRSGSERGLETLLFPLYASRLGRASLQLASVAQRRFYASDLGVSYLFVARKP